MPRLFTGPMFTTRARGHTGTDADCRVAGIPAPARLSVCQTGPTPDLAEGSALNKVMLLLVFLIDLLLITYQNY